MNNPKMSLEAIITSNVRDAARLQAEAEAKLAENDRIKLSIARHYDTAEMHKILSEPPPASRLAEAFRTGTTIPSAPDSTRLGAEKEVIFAALAIVRSWKRRHKKNYQTQETELMNAVERLTWEK